MPYAMYKLIDDKSLECSIAIKRTDGSLPTNVIRISKRVSFLKQVTQEEIRFEELIRPVRRCCSGTQACLKKL